jgi:TPR repeat protein
VERSAATNPGEAPGETSPAAATPPSPQPETSAETASLPRTNQPPPANATATPSQEQPAQAAPAESKPVPAPPTENAVTPAAQPQPTPTQPEETASASPAATLSPDAAAQPAVSGSAPASLTSSASQPSIASSQTTPPAREDAVTQGERYLYGNGVLEDCSLARKKLATAAERRNARALTLLGTMYATGHCAPHDLPTAYGWFARALRADPGNHRIEDDLSLIWRQMTPSEKQIALKK